MKLYESLITDHDNNLLLYSDAAPDVLHTTMEFFLCTRVPSCLFVSAMIFDAFELYTCIYKVKLNMHGSLLNIYFARESNLILDIKDISYENRLPCLILVFRME